MPGAVREDLRGRRFGNLVVTDYKPGSKTVSGRWTCRCDCGQERLNSTNMLLAGRAKSCGCTKSARIGDAKRTHGHTPKAGNSRAYRIWTNMKSRCLNPKATNYQLYGGRGITICDEWVNSFQTFLADMGEPPANLSLDRIDCGGPYSKSNCRWATQTEQMSNTRRNRMLMVNGDCMTMSEASRRFGVKVGTIWSRLKLGWSDEKAAGVAA